MKEIIPYILPLLSLVATIVMPILTKLVWNMSQSLEKATESISELNKTMAVLMDRDLSKGRVLEDHELRIRVIEAGK